MACEYCGRIVGHNPRCPKFEPEDPDFVCEICGDTIKCGEYYLENADYARIHVDCIKGTWPLLHWLDVPIKER